MTLDEYSRHVRQRLCWRCHSTTHRSHANQRQCRRCRRKWSYQRRLIQLDLLLLFSRHFTAAEACRATKVSYRTAWSNFLSFERTLRRQGSSLAEEFLRDPLLKFDGVREYYQRVGENRRVMEAVYQLSIVTPGAPLP